MFHSCSSANRQGAIAGLYEFAPQEEDDEAEKAAVAENGYTPYLELAEAYGSVVTIACLIEMQKLSIVLD